MRALGWTLVGVLFLGCGGEDAVPSRYEYLFEGSVGRDELPAVRARLPYDRIQLEWYSITLWGGERITLWRDGRALFEGSRPLKERSTSSTSASSAI